MKVLDQREFFRLSNTEKWRHYRDATDMIYHLVTGVESNADETNMTDLESATRSRELAILKCICRPKCTLLAVVIDGRRISPQKHSGHWEETHKWNVPETAIREALGSEETK